MAESTPTKTEHVPDHRLSTEHLGWLDEVVPEDSTDDHDNPVFDAIVDTVERIVAARLAAARADERAKVTAAVDAVLTNRASVYGEGTQAECLTRNIRATLAPSEAGMSEHAVVTATHTPTHAAAPRAPYYSDEQVTLHHGDSLAVLSTLPDASVDCCVTSPPYFAQRDYGFPGQYGGEDSPTEYVDHLRALFAEVRRVLTDDGTLWLNLGDSYYSGRGSHTGADVKQEARRGWTRAVDKPSQPWARPKSLLGIPWRTALALQDDGWILRNDLIWRKKNPVPDPARDRLATSHEHVFVFSKSRFYWFDRLGGPSQQDVWDLPSQPLRGEHYAVMPLALAEGAVAAGCKPGGVVLDPFSGSGTTGLATLNAGRRYVGIEGSAEYLDLSLRTRFAQLDLDLTEGA